MQDRLIEFFIRSHGTLKKRVTYIKLRSCLHAISKNCQNNILHSNIRQTPQTMWYFVPFLMVVLISVFESQGAFDTESKSFASSITEKVFLVDIRASDISY